MVMRGEGESAWPLLEASLAEAREIGHPIGECQALGFLTHKAYGEGDVDQAISLALESAAIAARLGWTWWEAGEYANAASMERELGRFDDAEQHAARELELGLGLGDRRLMVFAGAELASIAAERGNATRAGLLWGAVESETRTRLVGQWESGRVEYEPIVLRADGAEFAAARAEGGLLSIAQAAGPCPSERA
jgi:hypothetical protein